jgi:hypothetical protein
VRGLRLCLPALIVLAGLLVSDASASHRPPVAVQVVTADQASLQKRAKVKIRVTAGRAGPVRLLVKVRRGHRDPSRRGRSTVAARKVVKFRRKGTKKLSLPLTPKGRSRVASDVKRCRSIEVYVSAKKLTGRTRSERRKVNGSRILPRDVRACAGRPEEDEAPAPPPPSSGGGGGSSGPTYSVGVNSRTINTSPSGPFEGKPVYQGGYGFGREPINDRGPAQGNLGVGPQVRAIVISDGKTAFGMADIEVQGWFVANKDAPYGLVDMRREVEKRTGGRLKAQEVFIQSDHSHGGADPMGVWGGVPPEFREFMFDQTVEAVVTAFETRRPGKLYYGTAPAGDLLENQFDYDEANKVMDSDLRVLQARDADGKPFATLLNFSAHATVLGPSNVLLTGDWIQSANRWLEEHYGAEAITVVGTLGRTQPADGPCPDLALAENSDSDPNAALCKIDDYARKVVDRADGAVRAAQEIPGSPEVVARSYLIEDVSSNALLLGATVVGNEPLPIPFNRSITPPWLTGNVLGTVTGTARIGDVLLSSVPGEAYPQIALKVNELVPARGYMTAGLSNDQLGYLIAPFEAYPEPIRRSFFKERGDEVDPISNDNYFFNVSHTMGDRVTCSLLRGAGEVFNKGNQFRDSYDRCGLFFNDLAFPAGTDTRFSSEPGPPDGG